MSTQAVVGDADKAYFNGAIKPHTTESSVLISNSRYLNHAGLRSLIAQEMLRRNGPTAARLGLVHAPSRISKPGQWSRLTPS